MDSHDRKIYDKLFAHPIATDLEWKDFTHIFVVIATDVENESGDRLSVSMNGHREVFRRPHDGRVSAEDIENARRLINAKPADDPRQAQLLVVALDAEHAKVLDLVGRAPEVDKRVTDDDPWARRLRTVQKKTGKDLEHDLDEYFGHVYDALAAEPQTLRIVVLGHGKGKSNVAERFVEWLDKKHSQFAQRIAGIGDVDLSAANDSELATAAVKVARG